MPPDTSTYMLAGYAVFFVVFALYLLSLYLRYRNLRREQHLLREMDKEQ
ncbi:MAG: hypothetical protein ACUVRJ_02930 [Candidatus Villigracilaceae bacterium]